MEEACGLFGITAEQVEFENQPDVHGVKLVNRVERRLREKRARAKERKFVGGHKPKHRVSKPARDGEDDRRTALELHAARRAQSTKREGKARMRLLNAMLGSLELEQVKANGDVQNPGPGRIDGPSLEKKVEQTIRAKRGQRGYRRDPVAVKVIRKYVDQDSQVFTTHSTLAPPPTPKAAAAEVVLMKAACESVAAGLTSVLTPDALACIEGKRTGIELRGAPRPASESAVVASTSVEVPATVGTQPDDATSCCTAPPAAAKPPTPPIASVAKELVPSPGPAVLQVVPSSAVSATTVPPPTSRYEPPGPTMVVPHTLPHPPHMASTPVHTAANPTPFMRHSDVETGVGARPGAGPRGLDGEARDSDDIVNVAWRCCCLVYGSLVAVARIGMLGMFFLPWFLPAGVMWYIPTFVLWATTALYLGWRTVPPPPPEPAEVEPLEGPVLKGHVLTPGQLKRLELRLGAIGLTQDLSVRYEPYENRAIPDRGVPAVHEPFEICRLQAVFPAVGALPGVVRSALYVLVFGHFLKCLIFYWNPRDLAEHGNQAVYIDFVALCGSVFLADTNLDKLFYPWLGTVVKRFYYVPHLVTCVKRDYALSAGAASSKLTIRQRLLAIPGFPLPADMALDVLDGCEAVVQVLLDREDFGSAPGWASWESSFVQPGAQHATMTMMRSRMGIALRKSRLNAPRMSCSRANLSNPALSVACGPRTSGDYQDALLLATALCRQTETTPPPMSKDASNACSAKPRACQEALS